MFSVSRRQNRNAIAALGTELGKSRVKKTLRDEVVHIVESVFKWEFDLSSFDGHSCPY